MWRSKKFIAIVLLASVLVVGSIGGVALAQENEGASQPGALWDRVAEVYHQKTGVTLDQETLRDSFAEVQGEMREAARQNRIQKLKDEGKITQEQIDTLEEWWGERPEDVPMRFGGRMHGCIRGFGGPCVPAE